MRIAIVSLTRQGTALNLKLCEPLGADGFALERYRVGSLKGFASIHEVVRLVFEEYNALVFIGACGIAVRSISPYVKSKLTDIAVVVCDELGQYAIPILSGHLGGANRLSERVAELTHGTAVITTATDVNRKFSVDVWAKDNHLAILEPHKIREVSSAILDGIPVGFYSDTAISMPDGLSSSGSIGIAVSHRVDVSPFENTMHLLPRDLVLGIGCKRGTTMESIESLVLDTLNAMHYSIRSVVRVCSIELKASEVGLLEFCKEYSLPVEFFTSSELNSLRGNFSQSAFVESVTGVDCVCERSAVYGSSGGRLLVYKTSKGGVTLAVATTERG